MADENAARRLWQSGLALFVFGLAFGFFTPAAPSPRLALSAHLNAVQSGTFLIALGLLWPRLSVWPRAAAGLSWGVAASFWTLEAGMVLAALDRPASPAHELLKAASGAATVLGAAVMMICVGALLARVGGRRKPNASVGS